jgi:hypothetical protein
MRSRSLASEGAISDKWHACAAGVPETDHDICALAARSRERERMSRHSY